MSHPHPFLHVVGAAVLHRGRCLAARRAADMSEPLKWEFPGGKVRPREDPVAALQREIREELAIEIAVDLRLGWGESLVDDRRILLEVYTARWLSGRIELREHCAHGWFLANELNHLDWAAADRPLLSPLRQALQNTGKSA